jgi:23S rRNA pseudouridine1911/1915/1917 synthase
MEEKAFTVENAKVRLDSAIAEQFKDVSRSRIQKDIQSGRVSVDGKKIVENKYIVKTGERIVYEYSGEQKFAATGMDIPILFENNDLIIVDKPAGIPVHPAPGYKGSTLIDELLLTHPEIQMIGEDAARPGVVHRLDKDTSGAMLIAKNQIAFEHLKDAFATHKVKKEYIALVCGNLTENHGFINTPIGRHPTDFRKMSAKNPKEAKESSTEFFVEAHYIFSPIERKVDEYTQIKVKLHTGRTHQIRVHMASIGFPLAGDSLYGKKHYVIPELHRQFLHAQSIEVQLPDGVWIEAKSELPQDLSKVLDSLNKI